MSVYNRLPEDLVLSIIHEIEYEKFIKKLPDQIYVTPEEIVERIKSNRSQLKQNYGLLDFSELRKVCELDEKASFDKCLDVLCDYSNSVVILGEKIPKPLFKILENLWKNDQLIVFPPRKYPEYLKRFLDPTDVKYSIFKKFMEKYFGIKSDVIRSNALSLAEKIEKRTSSHNNIRLRSKIFEIIRLIPKIRYTPNIDFNCVRYRKTPLDKIAYYSPNVSAIKYVQEIKSLSPRNISICSFFDELRNIVNNGNLCPWKNEKLSLKKEISQALLLESIKIVEEALQSPELLGFNGAFSDFQLKSTKHIFMNLFLDDSNCDQWCAEDTCHLSKRNLTIVADTGAGKTYAFLIAPLIYITYKHLENPAFKVSQKPMCIMIYPRRDLAFDQYTSAKKICEIINRVSNGKVKLRVGRDYGGNIEYEASLIAANIEAIKRRLADPERNKYIDPDFLRVIVIDEIHLYSGILGLHFIYFLRRLGAFLKTKYYKQNKTSNNYVYPILVGASATIALPDVHSKKLFSLGYDKPGSADRHRKIWIENALEGERRGKRAIFHHVFILPKKFANLLGTLTDLTSSVLHNNPDPNYPELYNMVVNKGPENLTDMEKKRITKKFGKSLFFVDSISAIHRLAYYISDTERRNLHVCDAHRDSNFMCLTVYNKPLKFLPSLNIISSNDHREYLPNIIQIVQGPLLCQICKKQLNSNDASLSQYLERGEKICAITFCRKRKNGTGKVLVCKILDGCYFFRKGLCWYFAEFPFIDIHNNFIRSGEFTPDAIIPLRRTAQLREAQKIDDLDELFVEFLEDPPFVKFKRLAITSPVLEVGVDISNVRDVITFKTIRDLASYRQKTGRGGREMFSDIPVYTLISQRVLDRYVYRNPDIVADLYHLDPIPLKEHNTYFLKTHIFMAIFDYLAIWSKEYSNTFRFQSFIRNTDEKKSNLLKYIEQHEGDIKKYIISTFRYYESVEELEKLAGDAIKEFKKRLNMFFSDLPSNIQSMLKITKPISENVRNIDRKLLIKIADQYKDPEEIIKNLEDLLGVS
ncbi:MAG: DEAD/DEAH box helicase [Nitrososphaeria archaeon]